jgi:glutathione S-transferase
MTLILWGRRNSSNVQKAVWALEALGLDYERRPAGGSLGGVAEPAYRAMNPNGLVPTLQDGDLTLWESDAILRHIARKHGRGTLWPEDEATLAQADQWATWNSTTLWPSAAPVFFGTIRTARAEQQTERLAAAAEKMRAALAILDRALEDREHLIGDGRTFGEIGPAISARRILALPYGAPAREDVPNVARWLDALRARPVFRDHIDLPMGTCLEEWLELERADP